MIAAVARSAAAAAITTKETSRSAGWLAGAELEPARGEDYIEAPAAALLPIDARRDSRRPH